MSRIRQPRSHVPNPALPHRPPGLARARRRGPRVALGVLLVGVALAGCAGLTEPGWRREVDLIDRELAAAGALQLPPTARAGEPVDAAVATLGGSNCVRPAGASVAVAGLVATVVPYDRVPPAGTVCWRDRGVFPRAVRLRFGAPGEATVRVRGRDANGADVLVEGRLRVEP